METKKIFKSIRRFEKGLKKSTKMLYADSKKVSLVIDTIEITLDDYVVAKCRVCFEQDDGWTDTDFEVQFSADGKMSVQYYIGLIESAVLRAEGE